MGWASGSEILSDIIYLIEKKVSDNCVRKEIYTGLIKIFADYDCDTIEECMGQSKVFDAIIDGDE